MDSRCDKRKGLHHEQNSTHDFRGSSPSLQSGPQSNEKQRHIDTCTPMLPPTSETTGRKHTINAANQHVLMGIIACMKNAKVCSRRNHGNNED
jgi:hypothetical protein